MEEILVSDTSWDTEPTSTDQGSNVLGLVEGDDISSCYSSDEKEEQYDDYSYDYPSEEEKEVEKETDIKVTTSVIKEITTPPPASPPPASPPVATTSEKNEVKGLKRLLEKQEKRHGKVLEEERRKSAERFQQFKEEKLKFNLKLKYLNKQINGLQTLVLSQAPPLMVTQSTQSIEDLVDVVQLIPSLQEDKFVQVGGGKEEEKEKGGSLLPPTFTPPVGCHRSVQTTSSFLSSSPPTLLSSPTQTDDPPIRKPYLMTQGVQAGPPGYSLYAPPDPLTNPMLYGSFSKQHPRRTFLPNHRYPHSSFLHTTTTNKRVAINKWGGGAKINNTTYSLPPNFTHPNTMTNNTSFGTTSKRLWGDDLERLKLDLDAASRFGLRAYLNENERKLLFHDDPTTSLRNNGREGGDYTLNHHHHHNALLSNTTRKNTLVAMRQRLIHRGVLQHSSQSTTC